MSRTWSRDTLTTICDREPDSKWKESSRKFQTQCYHGYHSTQYPTINCSMDGGLNLLTERICFALYGMPLREHANCLLDGYSSDQKAETGLVHRIYWNLKILIETIVFLLFGWRFQHYEDSLLEIYSSDQLAVASRLVNVICGQYLENTNATVKMMTIFVCCKSDDGENTVPVFRIFLDDKTPQDTKFVDASEIVYDSWEDWLKYNKLPKMMYCFPKDGIYSCIDGSYHADKCDECPVLNFDASPAARISSIGAAKAKLMMVSSFFSSPLLKDAARQICAESVYMIEYRSAMSADEKGRSTFDRCTQQNKGNGPIEDVSGMVRILEKIINPDHLFNGISNADYITIDKNTRETLILSIGGTQQMPTSVPVNRTLFASGTHSTPAVFRVCVALQNYESFVTNDLRIDEMKPHEAGQLDTALLSKPAIDEDMIKASVSLATELNIKTIGEFCSMIGLVRKYTGGLSQRKSKLDELELNSAGRSAFLAELRADIAYADSIAKSAAITFASSLNAVLHFRKHAAKYFRLVSPDRLANFRSYLEKIPSEFFKQENLRNVEIQNGIICETYCTPLTANTVETEHVFGRLLKIPGNKKPIMITFHKEKNHIIDYDRDLADLLQRNTFCAPLLSTIIQNC